MAFCKIHLSVSVFGISGYVGMISRKLSEFIDILLGYFSGFMGGTFTI